MSSKSERNEDGSEVEQKHKGKKRRQGWHKGHTTARSWDEVMAVLPKVDVTIDLTLSEPGPLRRVGGKNRGSAI